MPENDIFVYGTDTKEPMEFEQDKFSWSVQLAGYHHDQVDQKGETSYEHFINEFETFPWLEQIYKANQFPEESAPTISVKDLKTEKDFWISMSGDRNNHGYITGYIYPKEKKQFFGLGKPKTVRADKMCLTEDKQAVKALIKNFFDRDHDALELEIERLGTRSTW